MAYFVNFTPRSYPPRAKVLTSSLPNPSPVALEYAKIVLATPSNTQQSH